MDMSYFHLFIKNLLDNLVKKVVVNSIALCHQAWDLNSPVLNLFDSENKIIQNQVTYLSNLFNLNKTGVAFTNDLS
jgi:hypothetical protein